MWNLRYGNYMLLILCFWMMTYHHCTWCSRRTTCLDNIMKFIVYLLGCNFKPSIFLFPVRGYLFRILPFILNYLISSCEYATALSTMQILWANIIADGSSQDFPWKWKYES
jgi:hypothetical protein